MIRAVVFDFRDTLVDVSGSWDAAKSFLFSYIKAMDSSFDEKTLGEAYNNARKQIVDENRANTTIHDWAPLIVGRTMRNIGISMDGEELFRVLQTCEDKFVNGAKLYDDVVPVLEKLKSDGIKMGLVIDGTVRRESAIIERLGLSHFFDAVSISEKVGENKFTDWPLRNAIRSLGAEFGETAVVGDRIDKDIIHANRLGCISIRLIRENGRYAEVKHKAYLEWPRYEIPDLGAVVKIVETENRRRSKRR